MSELDRVNISARATTTTADWQPHHESDWLLVLEANRRYDEALDDPRLASVLTMAWAALQARG